MTITEIWLTLTFNNKQPICCCICSVKNIREHTEGTFKNGQSREITCLRHDYTWNTAVAFSTNNQHVVVYVLSTCLRSERSWRTAHYDFNKQNNQYVLYILWTSFRQAHSWNTAQCDDFTKTIRCMRSVNQPVLVGHITEILPTWPLNTKKLTINLLLYMFCKLAFIISIANILSILTFRKKQSICCIRSVNLFSSVIWLKYCLLRRLKAFTQYVVVDVL